MQQYEPLHADRHGSAFNVTLIIGLGVAVVGLFSALVLWVILGLALAGFGWLTTPSQYMIFNDRLVIAYGRPRVRHIFFRDVDNVDPRLAIGKRLMVRLRQGRPLILQPRDVEEFKNKFEGALESYRSSQGGEIVEQES